MSTQLDEALFDRVVRKMVKNRSVFGAILRVENGDGSVSYTGAAGGLNEEDRYFIASVTKLYVTAVILRLRAEGRLGLEDRIHTYFPGELLRGLHVLKGVDRTAEITVAHLLSNTSGLPDYFSGKGADGSSAAADLLSGNDEAWPLERILETVRTMKPRFRPGQKGKASYSDTNYELLGAIVEEVTGESIGEVFRTLIFDALDLRNTYAFQDPEDSTPVPMYYRSKQVHLPRYIASVTAEGGIVSTAEETMVFLKAFFAGRFFPKEDLDTLKRWRFILSPGQFYYGIGLEKLWIPRIMTPFTPIGEILGFWGQSGAFAFHNPETDLYFTGTVNQLSGFGHSAALRAMIRIIQAARTAK